MTLALVACSSTVKSHDEAPAPPSPSVAAATPDAQPPAEPPEDVADLPVLHEFPGISLLESANSAIHTHGGPPADIDTLSLHFEVHDRRAHDIEARHVDFLRRSCNEEQWHDRQTVHITQHEAYAAARVAAGTATVTIPAGTPQRYFVRVAFATVQAYQACDIFAFEVDLVVDRVRAKFVIPLHVMREEPGE
jgi:hypothetical protein